MSRVRIHYRVYIYVLEDPRSRDWAGRALMVEHDEEVVVQWHLDNGESI